MSKHLRNDKRVTVSLAKIIWKTAENLMDLKGFNGNFSAYVADLIRRDQERLAGVERPSRVAQPPPAASRSTTSPRTHYENKTPHHSLPPLPFPLLRRPRLADRSAIASCRVADLSAFRLAPLGAGIHRPVARSRGSPIRLRLR
jgi:hypothetical protein